MGILNSNQDMKMAAMGVLAAAFLVGFRFCSFGPRHGGAGRALTERLAVDVEGTRGERRPSGRGETEPFRAPGAYYPEPVDAPMVSEDLMLPLLVAGLGGATIFGGIGVVGFLLLGRSGSGPGEGEVGGEEADDGAADPEA